jgi:hypothetical protein
VTRAVSEKNTTPAFARGALSAEGEAQLTREGRLRAAVVALGNALERQRQIDKLSPAARNLEQREIDRIYKEASAVL